MKKHVHDILEYSPHFNSKLIERFNDGDLHLAIPHNSIRLISHILNAQEIWNSRIEEKKGKTEIWKVHNKEDLQELENRNFEESLKILKRTELDKVISYKNSKGNQFENSVQEILFHVVNHSTYHRGQIATEFRKAGLEPIISDYIIYKR